MTTKGFSSGNASSTQTISRLLDVVCSEVNRGVNVYLPHITSIVTPENIFAGKKNIILGARLGRRVCFHVLHNCYGMSNREISEATGVSKRTIMRMVSKMRSEWDYDPLMRNIYEKVSVKLREGL